MTAENLENKICEMVLAIPTEDYADDYNGWLGICGSIKASGLPFELFDTWSARDTTKYNDVTCKSTWDSLNPTETPEMAINTLAKKSAQAGFDCSFLKSLEPKQDPKNKRIIGYMDLADFIKNDEHHNGSIRYNEITQRVEYNGFNWIGNKKAIGQILPHELVRLLSDSYRGVTDTCMCGLIQDLAIENSYNPIIDELEKGVWDGVDRLDLVNRTLGLKTDFEKMLVKKWLIQCVAMLHNSGTYGAEGVLTLLGKQGIRKTSFFRALVPDIKWFAEGRVLDVENKDNVINVISSWITELGEVDSTTKKEQSALKAFLTAYEDAIRLPYGKTREIMPRHTSMCATVNDKQFLTDLENRRWWVIEVDNIDGDLLEQLKADIWQLWYQIYQLWQAEKQGFRLTFDEQKEINATNAENRKSLTFEDEINDKFNWNSPEKNWSWLLKSEIRFLFEIKPQDQTRFGKAFNFIAATKKITTKTVKGYISFLMPPIMTQMDIARIKSELEN